MPLAVNSTAAIMMIRVFMCSKLFELISHMKHLINFKLARQVFLTRMFHDHWVLRISCIEDERSGNIPHIKHNFLLYPLLQQGFPKRINEC